MIGQKGMLSDLEFAALGRGQVAYIKKVQSDELKQRFPELAPIESGLTLWALFGAAGEPLVLSDAPSQALASAQEHELQMVPLQ